MKEKNQKANDNKKEVCVSSSRCAKTRWRVLVLERFRRRSALIPLFVVSATLLLATRLVGSTANAVTLTVEDATRLALEHDHNIKAAEAGEAKARAEARQAFMGLFPKLSVSAGYTRLDQVPYVEFDLSSMTGDTGTSSDPCADIDESTLPPGWTVDMAQSMCYMILGWMYPSTDTDTVSRIEMGVLDNYFVTGKVEQVLFAGGALLRTYQAKQDFHKASWQQVRKSKQDVAFSTAQSFYQLMLARDAARVTEESLETMSAYVKDLTHLVDAGVASRADLLAAQARESQAKLDAMKAKHGARLAETAFKVSLGLPRSESLELQMEDKTLDDIPGERDDLVSMARAKRPDLATIDANLNAMKRLANATWASWLPSFVAMGDLNFKNPNYSLQPEWYMSADVTIAASWNIWDRGVALQSNRAMRASILQLRHQREMFSEMLDVELEAALTSFDEAVQELKVAKVGLAQAEESFRLEEERFKQGMVANIQLLTAHTALSGAKLSLLQAETKMRISHASLRKAVGLDPEVTQ